MPGSSQFMPEIKGGRGGSQWVYLVVIKVMQHGVVW